MKEDPMNMESMFEPFKIGSLTLANRFVFPPIKTAFGTPQGVVTERHLGFYRQIASNGPGVLILEPVAVTIDGKEHPKQLCIHQPESASEIKKIVDVIHAENRLACLHLNHAGAAANPKATGAKPKAPAAITCPSSGQTAEPLSEDEIDTIVDGYWFAALKAVDVGIDMLEIQGGHGYLLSQFLNSKVNQRRDTYGENRLFFAERVLGAVKTGAPDLPLILRISGSEMSPEFGISPDDLLPLLKLAEETGISALHVGMGSACFSPPWYFHHASLPEKPQWDAVAWVREHTDLPIIMAGRMGRTERVVQALQGELADLIALGRPLISDPDLIEKWRQEKYEEVKHCGYCLQGCLHRVKNGEPIGCNLNPEIGKPELEETNKPLKVLVAGGGPAGMSAALYLSKRGHQVTLAEKDDRLGGQFNLAWQAPGKQKMQEGLDNLDFGVRANVNRLMFNRAVDTKLLQEVKPDLMVWSIGSEQNIPKIEGLENQYAMTSLEYFKRDKPVKGPRVLVIGAGRTGLEIAEKLGHEGFEVVATKRTDPIGSMMEMITKKLTLMRIVQMARVSLMPQTAVKLLGPDKTVVEKDGEVVELEAFQTVILSSGMLSMPGPDKELQKYVPTIETIGDAAQVMDIYSAVHAGYDLAAKY
jgi:2,4-dienoyl-CoA reductase-like NADH-dependent reductase (Old Yellow Enzyme family)/thioredoxin reductase